MMDEVDFELCLDVDRYCKKPKSTSQPQNQPEAEAEAAPPPKSPLVRKYAEFADEDEYTTISAKKGNDNDTGPWLSLPPKRPRLSPSDLGLGLGDYPGHQGHRHVACTRAGSETDAGVDGDGDTMMDVDAGSLSSVPAITTTTATPPIPSPGRKPVRPSRLPTPSASTQFAIYEDPETMDVDDPNTVSTPLRSPMYSTASVGHTVTTSGSNNNSSHYLQPYVSSQSDEDKENTENDTDGEGGEEEEDSNTGETLSSQQSTLTSLTEGDQEGEHQHQHQHQQHNEEEEQEQGRQADDEADDDHIYSRDSATTPFTRTRTRRVRMTRRRRPLQYYHDYTHDADWYLGQQPGYEYGSSSSDTSTNANISTSVRGFVGGEPSWAHSPGSSSAITAWGGGAFRERGDTTTAAGDIADGPGPVDIRQEMLSSAAVPGDYHHLRGELRRGFPSTGSNGGATGDSGHERETGLRRV